MAEREQFAAFALHGPVICRIEPERKSVVGPSLDEASPVRGAQTTDFFRLRALAADGQRSSARALVAVGRMRQPGDRFMFFFKKPARPRPLRARPILKSRLRVEQLETRVTPVAYWDGSLASVAGASGSGSTVSGSPVIATDSNGDFVVAWTGISSTNGGSGVFAQRYAASGAAQGSTTRVNTATGYSEQDPSIAMDSVGDYVVTWSSYGQDGGGWGVYAQRFNSCGVAQGSEFRVNTTTAGDQMHARVAMDSAGNFTVAWQSYGQDGSGWGIYAQRYSATGLPLGGELQVNNTTSGDQEYPAIAMNGTGSFVVSWSSNGQDGSGWGVCARRYAPAAIPQGNEYLVNTTTTGDQTYSAVGIDATGDSVVSWSSNQIGSWATYARRYNCSGVAQGCEFQVGTRSSSTATYSAVAMDGVGDFVITWSSCQCGTWTNYGQQFSAAGVAQGTQFLIGSTTASYQTYTGVAMTATGNFILVCSGTDSNGNSGVFTQLGNLC
jgi:hypothetical protein